MQQNMAIQTKGPIYKISDEDLLQFSLVGGKNQAFEFSKQFVWVAESSTEIEYHHGGKILKKGAHYNDYYGFFTSLNHKEAHDFAESFGITEESSLVLVCRTYVHLTPYLDQNKAHNADKRAGQTRHFEQIPAEWLQKIQPGEDSTQIYRSIKEPVLLTSEITWSSKYSPEENLALAEALKGRFPCEDFAVVV
ncbi:hypothetical protein [Pseudomonas serbica]|uniref:hypothetical protein n=1 Tax=Pseudomonas serbica TaxID=2965074 RepID=UPI00237C3958|nr:hypothetical protein [Pseudomonas serbica]